MNATAAKPKEQYCQGVSRMDEPCDQSAQQYCERSPSGLPGAFSLT